MSVDLSGIRLHAGPRTDAFLRAYGYPAAAAGHRVFMPARRGGDGEHWLRVLAHEIAHAVQQAQGLARAEVRRERQAEAAAAAAAVIAGHVYPDTGLQPPRPGHGVAVLAGFNSWEHRLLGDVPSDALVRIATRTQNWQDVVRRQITLMGLWQNGGAGVDEDAIRQIDPDVGVVTLPGSGCLATCGELNAIADFAASAGALSTMPRPFVYAFLQQIRQEIRPAW